MKMLLVSVEGPPEDPWLIPPSFTAESEGPSGPEHASQFPKRCFVDKDLGIMCHRASSGGSCHVLGAHARGIQLSLGSCSLSFRRAQGPSESHLWRDCEVTRWWESVSSLPNHRRTADSIVKAQIRRAGLGPGVVQVQSPTPGMCLGSCLLSLVLPYSGFCLHP